MHRLNEQMVPVPLPVPLYRGVHSYDELPAGQTVFYALTSEGGLLNGELRRRLPGETADGVVADMWKDLDTQDPVSDRPRLALVVDGAFRPSRVVPPRDRLV